MHGVISYAVWLYHRFNLSHRDIEDVLAERGITVSHESIRLWCIKFGPEYAKRFFRRPIRRHGTQSWKIITDKLGSYRVAHRALVPDALHVTDRYANNRAFALPFPISLAGLPERPAAARASTKSP